MIGELEGDDIKVKNKMVNAWVDFISFGEFSNEDSWKSVESRDIHQYWNISGPNPSMHTNSGSLEGRMLLWEEVMFSDIAPPIVCLNTNENVCYNGSWKTTGIENHGQYDHNAIYASFQGIQYGQAPIGDLRFKAPLPFTDVDGIHDVSKKADILCPQFDGREYDINQVTENCLFLNVYVPKIVLDRSDYPKAVLVWIHGGALQTGSGRFDEYGPQYFMEQENTIIVTINYRLGPLGFLSLGNEDVPGNAGFKDQIMALQWVNDNIAKFGGDTVRIAIAGESAGSASVALHLVSPLSNGLFQRAILQSGTGLSPGWHPHTPDEGLKQGEMITEALNCKGAEYILTCLQSKDVIDIVKMRVEHAPSYMAIQDDDFTNTPYLPSSVEEIFQSGQFNTDVEVIIGTNSDEGILTVGPATHGYSEWDSFRQDMKENGPTTLFNIADPSDFTHEDFERVNTLVEYYTGSFDNINKQHTQGAVDMITDSLFQYGTHQTIKYLVENNVTVYQYLLTYQGEYSTSPIFEVPAHNGVCHGEDLIYLWVIKSYGLADITQVLGNSTNYLQ